MVRIVDAYPDDISVVTIGVKDLIICKVLFEYKVDEVPPTDNLTPVTILPVDNDQVDEEPRRDVIDGVRNVILLEEHSNILVTFIQVFVFFKDILIELLLQSLENPYPDMYITVPPAIDP
jgi:hypothetical protein